MFKKWLFPSNLERGETGAVEKIWKTRGCAFFLQINLCVEMGKLLERIIVQRIERYMEDVGPNLSPNQFGFRRNKSTVAVLEFVGSLELKVLRSKRRHGYRH